MAKRALIVGCNYAGSPHQLAGCANDGNSMRSLLCEVFNYQVQNVVMMVDSDAQTTSPTGVNIKAELDRLVALTGPGDTLFFHYSGHGTQIPTDDPQETDGLDEAIVPTDMNVILDDDLRVIVCKLPMGARFTMLADCCHSGTMLDHKLIKLPLSSASSVKDKAYIGPATNKSLPYDMLLAELGRTTGQQVLPGNLRYSLTQAFGPDASLKAQAYLGMLGEAFREEVAANGGRLPALTLSTLADLATRLWLKARAWKGTGPTQQGLNPQGAPKRYGQQGVRPPGGMAPYPPVPPHWARYPANANPNIALVPYPAFYSSAAVHGPSTSPQQLTAGVAMQPSSSSSHTPSVVATQFPQIPVHASPLPQQAGGPGLLTPNAASYPPAMTAGEAKNASHNPSSPDSHQQQQQLQQYTGEALMANPMFGMQPLQASAQGYPNPVSQRVGQHSRVSSVGYPGYSGVFDPSLLMAQSNQQGSEKLKPGTEVSSQHHSKVGFLHHRYHSKDEKLIVPMDWHMDVLAGKTPATFSPLGEQAMSASFPPVSEPIGACPDYAVMDQGPFWPAEVPPSEDPCSTDVDYDLADQGFRPSPGPKPFTQHAFRVSTQKFAPGDFSHLVRPPRPSGQLIAAETLHQGYGIAAYPSQGNVSAVDPSQACGVAACATQDNGIDPSQIVYSMQQQVIGGAAQCGSAGCDSPAQPVLSSGMEVHLSQGGEAAPVLSQPAHLATAHTHNGQGYQGQGYQVPTHGGASVGGPVLVGANGRPRISGKPGSKPHPSNQLHPDVGVLISGCCDSETSADSTSPADPSRACGAMTNAVVSVVREHYYNYPSTPLTNRDLVVKVRAFLDKAGFAQHPCLGCSKQNANLAFAV